MKKLTKTFVALGCVAALSASVCALAACGGETTKTGTGEAYGAVHGAGYVGYSKITVDKDAVTDLTLTEICFPTQVSAKGTSTESAEAAVAALVAQMPAGMTEDDFAVIPTNSTKDGTTTYTATAYYKTVSYGEVTMTYDTTAGAYKVGTQTLQQFFQTEANCKAYYEAVIGGTVKASGKTGVMTKAALCKDDNGYWTRKDNDNNDYSRWKMNRDATVKYVKENGVGNLLKLTKPGKDENNKQITNGKDFLDKDVAFWMDGEISTGATWNDFNPANAEGKDHPESNGVAYVSYAQLILNAYKAVK